MQPCERSLGVVGDLDPRAEVDFLQKLSAAIAAQPGGGRAKILVERRSCAGGTAMPHAGSSAMPLADARITPTAGANDPSLTSATSLDILDSILNLAGRGAELVVLPCFGSYALLAELRANSPLPIADMVTALRDYVRTHHPTARRIGIVTSADLHRQRVFERCFTNIEGDRRQDRPADFDIRYVLIAGKCSLDELRAACSDLAGQGVELLIPAGAQLIPLAQKIGPVGIPIIDPHRVYAQYVVAGHFETPPRPFKLGVVGGVGPAATADFLRKVVRNTPAHRDQDHLKLLLEQNPQIPDRTAHLLGRGPDPTLALYATCRRLQDGNADLIAIPCNTAHAYIEAIQPHLEVPIINMLHATVSHVLEAFPGVQDVGLLATSGTLSSGIYHRALETHGLRAAVPPPALQTRMMAAIYGAVGIKAGFTSGQCVDDIHEVIDELVSRSVEVVILGCTELPLLFNHDELIGRNGQRVALVDPTEILAVRCIREAKRARS